MPDLTADEVAFLDRFGRLDMSMAVGVRRVIGARLASRDALLAEQAATIAQLDGLLKDLERVLGRGRRHLKKKSARASAVLRPDPSEAKS